MFALEVWFNELRLSDMDNEGWLGCNCEAWILTLQISWISLQLEDKALLVLVQLSKDPTMSEVEKI